MTEQELIEIEETLKKTESEVDGYLKKVMDIKFAIETLEAEDISLPESVYGTLSYYQSELENKSKVFRQLLGLRNKLKHNYEIF